MLGASTVAGGDPGGAGGGCSRGAGVITVGASDEDPFGAP